MSSFFDLGSSTLTLNGTTITGFSDATDCFSIEQLDMSTVRRGADGGMTASSTGNRGVNITLKLLPTSNSVKFLSKLLERHNRGDRVVFNGTFVSAANGTSLSMINGVFTSGTIYPTLGKGESSDMEYVIAFESTSGNFESANFEN